LSARLLLSCGEASGDLYAGALARQVRAIDPGADIFGLGGPQLADAGGRLIVDYRGLAATGVTEVLPKLGAYLAAMRALVAAAERERPDALVVIDFPDFNFRLARRVKRLGIRVVYYISPQIWAWRQGRLKTIRALADRVLVIFPFEEPIYREAGVPVEFVGHPLVELTAVSAPRAEFLAAHGLSPEAPTVAVLPGSRTNEVSRILPDLLTAANRISEAVGGVQFVIARAPHLEDALFRSDCLVRLNGLTKQSDRAKFAVVEGDTDAVLASADVALTASGTATIQAALHDTPMVVVYRVSPMTYRVAKHLVRVPSIAMVNLIAGEQIVPELVQDAFTPDAVAREAISMLTDHDRAARIRSGLARVRERLGGPGASRRAAEAILRLVSERTSCPN
jgi:lipid-A-disaccharide synthase